MSICNRKFTLSIAGFAPSGGAGLLADIRTFESLECYGLAVNTANTIQNDKKIEACQKAKKYTEKLLASNETLLGYHNL